MEWGKYADQLPETAQDKRPSLLPGLDIYLNAYNELQSDRSIGMAAGPIPWYSLIRWAEFHGMTDPDDVDVLIRYVRAMEAEAHKINKKGEPG